MKIQENNSRLLYEKSVCGDLLHALRVGCKLTGLVVDSIRCVVNVKRGMLELVYSRNEGVEGYPGGKCLVPNIHLYADLNSLLKDNIHQEVELDFIVQG